MAKPPASAETKSFTIVLPAKAAERLEKLVELELYGSTRAEVAKSIILEHLRDLWKAGTLKD